MMDLVLSHLKNGKERMAFLSPTSIGTVEVAETNL